ncbi:MAG: hypothetical protein QOG76_6912, partial [Pseudonocardiales bacterium]|nr:hypothetical protein [Pseudonocardiales bacterium]
FLLIMAGYETTVNLIGNSVFALLRDPPQLAALLADPALIPGGGGEIALGRLLHRFDTITLDDRAPAPRYRISTLMRGLDALAVRLSHS